MSSSFASPFLRPGEETVSKSPWLLTGDNGSEPLKDPVPDWDYSVELPLSRTIQLDASEFLAGCHLGAGSRIAVVVHMKTGDAGVRKLVHKAERELSGVEKDCQFLIEPFFHGSELQGNLELTTRIVLVRGVPQSPLAPSQAGSRLWEDVFNFQLEGGGGRLPMEAADFRKVQPEYARAPWFLDVEATDLEASFLGSCRVILNFNRDDVIAAVERKEATVLSLLSADLVRHVTEIVIENDEFIDHSSEYEEGSIGFTVSDWMKTAFPGKSLNEIRTLRRTAPAKFRAVLASTYGGNHGAT